jgi:hypothetical protein
MKKIICLIIVFLCISFIIAGKNHNLGNLNALPGIPIIHDETGNRTPEVKNNEYDTPILTMFINVSTDSVENYLQYVRDYGDPYMVSKGNMNISFWLKQRLNASGSHTMVYDTFGLSNNKVHYCGTISIVPQTKSISSEQKLLVAHKTPVIIYNPCQKSKACFQKSNIIIPKYFNGFEWKGDFYGKTLACHLHLNTLFNLHIVISDSKPECFYQNDSQNSYSVVRKPEVSAVESQGLEFILPQRI